MSSPLVEALRRINRATKGAGPLRQAAILTYRNSVRLHRFLPPPRVLVNGPAKSGTHLLADCVAHFPHMMFSGRHLVPGRFGTREELDAASLTRFLDRCPDGMFVTAHAPAWPELGPLFDALGFRHVLLLRDPRDMVVSFTHFVVSNPQLPRHRHFTENLRTPGERLLAAITGYEEGPHPLPPVSATLEDYLPWLGREDVCECRFEDLLGPRAGRTREAQIATVREVAAFVDRPLHEAEAAEIADAAWSRRGLTFRSGEAGGWRTEFGEEHVAAFKELAGRHLVTLGYETDLSW